MSNIKVTVKPRTTLVSSIKPGLIRPKLNLGDLLNVDVLDPDDGEVLVYDSANNKYVIKEIVVNANNITNIVGGTF
jgi:hypothetical protein